MKWILAVTLSLSLLASSFAQANTDAKDNEIAYGMFQDMGFPPGTNRNMCDVYSQAASQITEMRNDRITLSAALEDVGRIDVPDERVFLTVMTRAAYSKQGRKVWKDPRSALWSVQGKCNKWLHGSETTAQNATPSIGPDLSRIPGGVDPRVELGIKQASEGAANFMRNGLVSVSRNPMGNATGVCAEYAQSYRTWAMTYNLKTNPRTFREYADNVGSAAYSYCGKEAAKIGVKVDSSVAYMSTW
ncbi:hypothetical protein [Burkholderia aenigmatica]|nr:hypothetical protein [Burkholderia aenigmatica]